MFSVWVSDIFKTLSRHVTSFFALLWNKICLLMEVYRNKNGYWVKYERFPVFIGFNCFQGFADLKFLSFLNKCMKKYYKEVK